MLPVNYRCTRRMVLIVAALISSIIPASAQKKKDNTPLVDVFIGTQGNGHTYPGAVLPYGMVQLSPVTRTNGAAYQFTDTVVYGFAHARYNTTDTTEQSEMLFMPSLGDAKLGMDDNLSGIDKKEENASPGYYKTLLKNGIEAEFTTTLRAGIAKYDFPKTEKANIIINLQYGGDVISASAEIINATELRGYRLTKTVSGNRYVYFHAKFSEPFKTYGIAADEILQQGETKAEGKNIKLYVQFNNPGDVMVKVGLSHVSAAGALMNLDLEIPEFDFKAVKKAAKDAWINELAKIQVEGGAPEKNARDNPIPAGSGPYRRSGKPAPDYGLLKRTAFYTALYHTLLTPHTGSDVDGRYSYGDGKITTATGFDYYDIHDLYAIDNPLYQLLALTDHKRMLDIIKSCLASPVKNETKGIWVPLLADAALKGIKSTKTDKSYAAFKSLADSMRKEKAAEITEDVLDSLFAGPTPVNAYSALPYWYNFTQSPQKTQVILQQLIKHYTTAPNGLPGNDNEAQLSAWYVLSSLGLYAIAPGQQQYTLGLPQFDKAVITLAGDKKFAILNSGAGITRNNIYIQGLNLNKETYNKLYLNYTDIAKGGEFEVFTGTLPNKLLMMGLKKPSLKQE